MIRIRKNPESIREPYFITLSLAYILIVLWAIGVAFTGYSFVRNFRPLAFGFALLFWGISIYLNPLSLSLTSTKIKSFIIATHSGLPIISLDTTNDMETDVTLLMPLISAVKASMETFVKSEGDLSTIDFENSLLAFIKGKKVLLIMELHGNFSSNIELMGKVYLNEFEEKYAEVFKAIGQVVEPDLFHEENKRIFQMIKSIAL